jgi:ATP/maltotriose-dependent transcriptional regulator MalT
VSTQAAQELTRVLGELQGLERERLSRRYLRHSDGTEQVREAVRRLGESGSPALVIKRSAEEFGASSDKDVVLVSRIDGDQIRAQAIWSREDQTSAEQALRELHDRAIPLRYPLVEAEAAHRHRGLLVSVSTSSRRASPELAATLRWHSYAVVPIMLEGKAAGLLHTGRTGEMTVVDELDLELAVRYANGLAQVFERAVLREQLQRQQAQLGSAAQWINAQTIDLSNLPRPTSAAITARGDGDLAGVLTSRELDVMRLIARGQSNREIATTLMVGEGTVKYHVKNVLRKLQARSRSQAISRYVHLYKDSEM